MATQRDFLPARIARRVIGDDSVVRTSWTDLHPGQGPRRGSRRGRRSDRGASLVEYALIVGLVVVALIGVIQYMTDESSDELDERSNRVGAPDVDATGATPPTTSPSGPPGGGGTLPPAPTVATVQDLEGCWASSGNKWSATFQLTLEDTGSGGPIEGATVSGEFRIFRDAGLDRVEPVTEALSGFDGLVVVTRADLTDSGQQGSRDRRVEFVVSDVTGTNVSYALPAPPPSASTTRATGGERC